MEFHENHENRENRMLKTYEIRNDIPLISSQGADPKPGGGFLLNLPKFS